MFEASYELVLHSSSYARSAWRGATPWNPPSARTLPPGGAATYGLRLLLAPSLEQVERTLLRAGHPVAQPLPTPVLHRDMSSAALLLSLPAGFDASKVSPSSIDVSPSSALTVRACEPAGLAGGAAARLRCVLAPRPTAALPADGRVRLTLTLPRRATAAAATEPPLRMSVHLFVAESAAALVSKHGTHGVEKAWLPSGAADPWHRDGAFFGWDDARLPLLSVTARYCPLLPVTVRYCPLLPVTVRY